jgi:hypothetical protein
MCDVRLVHRDARDAEPMQTDGARSGECVQLPVREGRCVPDDRVAVRLRHRDGFQ